MVNLHAFGNQLSKRVRETSAAHSISIRRIDSTVGPFPASSPPIGHELLTDTGMDISDQNRDFYFHGKYLEILEQPQIGDIVIDHSDNSEWRVLPQNDDYAWSWHGQMRTEYHVVTKQDK